MFEKCATAQIATLRIFFGTKFESQMSRARSEIIFRENYGPRKTVLKTIVSSFLEH